MAKVKEAAYQDTPAPQARAAPITLTATAAQQIETLKVDIAKLILDEMKLLQKPWQKMNEGEQARLITRAADIAGQVVHRGVTTIATRGFKHFEVALGKFAVDKGIEFKCTMPFSKEAIGDLCSRRATTMILVARDENAFLGGKMPKPEVVGDLGIPKGKGADAKDEARADEANLAKVGRGNGKSKAAAPTEQQPQDQQPGAPQPAPSPEEKPDPETGELPPKPATDPNAQPGAPAA